MIEKKGMEENPKSKANILEWPQRYWQNSGVIQIGINKQSRGPVDLFESNKLCLSLSTSSARSLRHSLLCHSRRGGLGLRPYTATRTAAAKKLQRVSQLREPMIPRNLTLQSLHRTGAI